MNGGSFAEARVTLAPRRLRERIQRRADILRSAESVFAARGFHDASIEEIARAAEYATGTVYLYFRDKEALYLELFEEKVRELSKLIAQRTLGTKNPVEAIRQMVVARMEFFEQNRAFFRIYAREGLSPHEDRRNRWSGVMRLYTEYLELLAGWIGAGQRRGLLRKGDPHLLAVALSGMMIQLTRDRLQSQHERPLTDLTGFVLDLFLSGASAST